MEKNDIIKNTIYNLVLEIRPGDNCIIEINSIPTLDKPINNTISSIDEFTSKYTVLELKRIIEQNNLVESKYLDGSFKVISSLNHHLEALTKEKFDVILEFQNDTNEMEQSLKDKLYGFYKKIIEQFISDNLLENRLKAFKEALKNNNKNEIFRLLGEIPYSKSRSIYFMINDELVSKLNRARKLEKIDEN